MTQTRAVLLGFAGVAFVLVLVSALFLWSFVASVAGPPPDAAETQAVNQVFDAKTRTFDPVRGIERVLPVGMPWSSASAALTASSFVCKGTTREFCDRDSRMGPCRFARHIEIDLTEDRRISSISATETPTCL